MKSGEKELILCNLVARRDTMLRLGGFNEALYPNEENALMDEIQKQGGKLLYDPEFFIYRRHRRTLKAFIKMLMNYGRGRAEQFREHPTFGSTLNFVPPLFAFISRAAISRVDGFITARTFMGDFAGSDCGLVPRGGICAQSLRFTTDRIDALGLWNRFWRGLFTKLKPASVQSTMPVSLETVPH